MAVTIDPLLLSFAEGAAYRGILVQRVGGDPNAVDFEELLFGLGRIYTGRSLGQPWAAVDEQTAGDLLENDEFVSEMFYGVSAFLFMHELAHADLGHSGVNHTAAVGAEAVLREDSHLSAECSAQGRAPAVQVFTETQADIYAATLLRRANVTSDAPVVLFSAAMAAYLLESGACRSAPTQDEL